MDIKTINTPEQLNQAIGKFLQSDYSHENLIETYDDARKCAIRFRGDYSALPALPAHKDNPLDGLQDVMDWCIKSSKVVDNIVFNLERQTISAVVSHLKKLRDVASRALSLVNSKLREQAQKEARVKVENEYKDLNEKASRFNDSEMLLSRRVEVAIELEQEARNILKRETEDIVQIYLSKDPTFKNKLSKLRDEEINEELEAVNKLVGSNTPTGKLLDIYCKLKDIHLQWQFNDVGYAYSLDDYTDMICGGCNKLYTSIDTVIKTFEEIQTKADIANSKPAETKLSVPTAINDTEEEFDCFEKLANSLCSWKIDISGNKKDLWMCEWDIILQTSEHLKSSVTWLKLHKSYEFAEGFEREFKDLFSDVHGFYEKLKEDKLSEAEIFHEQIPLLEDSAKQLADYVLKVKSNLIEKNARVEQNANKIKLQKLIPISQIIAQGEGHTIEFKETLEYDVKTSKNNQDVLLSSLKTIAGFLNADDGTMLIGVNDSGKIMGIKRDLSTMQRGNNDRFEQKIRNCLKDRFNPQPIGKVNISFETFNEGAVCRVDVIANKEVVHLDRDVYVRDGNITQKLEGRNLTDWVQHR